MRVEPERMKLGVLERRRDRPIAISLASIPTANLPYLLDRRRLFYGVGDSPKNRHIFDLA